MKKHLSTAFVLLLMSAAVAHAADPISAGADAGLGLKIAPANVGVSTQMDLKAGQSVDSAKPMTEAIAPAVADPAASSTVQSVVETDTSKKDDTVTEKSSAVINAPGASAEVKTTAPNVAKLFSKFHSDKPKATAEATVKTETEKKSSPDKTETRQ